MKNASRSSAANSAASRQIRPELRANSRVWMYAPNATGVFGDGKCRILEAIDKHGSLLAATREIGMSYRKAWADLRKAEECLGVRLLTRMRGGRAGGATTLTDAARVILAAYHEFRQETARCVDAAFLRFVERTSKAVTSERCAGQELRAKRANGKGPTDGRE